LDAARFAAQIADAEKAALTLGYVMAPMGYSPDWSLWNPREVADTERQWAEKMLSVCTREVRGSDLNVDAVLLTGSPAETLADYAEAEGFDLVVSGSRGRGAVARTFLGSVSDRLCHICKKPVLVVR
jgi:nucleotide-binding universal stress UspA family protein